MDIKQVMVGACAIALSGGCDTGREGDLGNARNGTSGYGTYTGGGTYSGGGTYTGGEPDLGGGGGVWDLGGGDFGGGFGTAFDTSETCQVEGKKKSILEDPPFKTPGGYWDQSGWGACTYIALINANIDSGADDTAGAFEARVRECLADEGISDLDIANGLSNSEIEQIAECKEEAMDEEDSPVSIDEYRFTGWFFPGKLKNRCEDLEDALDAGGSGTVSFRNNGKGHGLTVTDVECNETTGDVTLTLRDPNHPNLREYTVVVDCDNDVTSVAPAHFFLDNDAEATRLIIETPE